jgi:hypothetical protein
VRPEDEGLQSSAPDRSPPHSAEAEEHVLATCLLDGHSSDSTIGRCLAAGVTPEFFYFPANRLIYQVVLDIYKKCPPVTVEVLIEELSSRRQIEAVGGFPYIMQVTGKIPTTAHAGFFIAKLKDKYLVREMIKTATMAIEKGYAVAGDIEQYVKEIDTDIQRVIRHAEVVTTPVIPLPDFRIPAKGDDRTLLGSNRYLSRGDSLIIVSSSGMGKSSILLQAATLFALGRPFFGIACPKPRRTLILQAEDSDGDVAEVWCSIMVKMQLSPAEIAQVRSNVFIVREKVNRGAAFIHKMRLLAQRLQVDFVGINPLQNYVEGDITDKKVVGDFLYDGLNRANEGDMWAYLIVHHTTKPATGQNAKQTRNWNEVMYDMAGASTLIDWARAIMILKATKKEGEFNLQLAKRGKRAGVLKVVGNVYEPTTTIPLKHASGSIEVDVPEIIKELVNGKEVARTVMVKQTLPTIYWEARETADEPEKPKREKKEGSHANELYPDEEVVSYFPVSTEEPIGYTPLAKDAKVGCGIGSSAFAQRIKRLMSNGLIVQTELGKYRRTPKGDEVAKAYLEAQP